MIHHTFSITQALLIFLIGGVLGALVTFASTLKFAGKLKWRLGFNEAEQLYFNNLESAIGENEVLKRQLAKLSTDLTDSEREVRRLRKLYAESCRLLAAAKESSEQDDANEAARAAMSEQVNRIEASGGGKRAYTR